MLRIRLLAVALVFFYGASLGGLPIALLAVVLVLSTVFSAFCLVVLPASEINSYLGAYLSVQLVAAIGALPLWRRLLERASRARMDARVLQLAA